MYNIYELTGFSQQKTKTDARDRLLINAVISDMKRGHFSNEKTISNSQNVLKTAGATSLSIAGKPQVREVRVTQSLRIFFFESQNASGVETLTLLCLGHMKGNDVNLI